MKTIVVYVSIGYVGANKEIEFEIEDDATEEQINEVALECLFDMIDWNWWVKDDD